MSLPDEDVEFLETYARSRGLTSRSAALHRAVRLLRTSELTDAYADAWETWDAGPEARLWESTVGDGLKHRP